MKQFNLEEYLKNPLKKVITRDGRPVKIYCTNYTKAQNIIAQIEGNDYSISFHKDGIFTNGFESNWDLFFAPEKHEGWINLYKWNNSIGCYVSNPFSSEEKAVEEGKTSYSYLKTIKIEWEA